MSRSNRLLVRPRLAQSHVMINKHKCRGFFLLSSHMVCVLITHPKHLISTGFRPVGLLSSPDLENVVQIRTGQSQSNPDRHLRCRKFLHFLSAVRVIRVLCLDLRSCFYLLRLRPESTMSNVTLAHILFRMAPRVLPHFNIHLLALSLSSREVDYRQGVAFLHFLHFS